MKDCRVEVEPSMATRKPRSCEDGRLDSFIAVTAAQNRLCQILDCVDCV
jgi:hypothetical protein